MDTSNTNVYAPDDTVVLKRSEYEELIRSLNYYYQRATMLERNSISQSNNTNGR